jgi:gamma-glutamyltranspeptidase/glutathione hydrolase
LDIRTGRPVTLATNGMVTSPHSLSSAAGLDVLRAGGSAIDAAIAASAVLAVVYPHMTGLGGDAFWLIHDGASGEIRTLNGGGKAAEGATLSALEARGLNEIPLRGIVPATLTVPGAVASWIEAHAVHGRLPLGRVLESAIAYARDSFPVTGRLAGFIEMMRDDLLKDREAAALFFPQGTAAPTGAKLSNANLARTLQSIADHGWDGFYGGAVAAGMARFSEENGGLFRLGDFGRQKAVCGSPNVGL